MASRFITFLAAFLVMAHNCNCNRMDDVLRDYYNKMYLNSGRIGEKRNHDQIDTTTEPIGVLIREPSIDPVVTEVAGPLPPFPDMPKRTPVATSDTYSAELKKELFGHVGGLTRNGVWPCYCKYL